jgi:hypothetical protein
MHRLALVVALVAVGGCASLGGLSQEERATLERAIASRQLHYSLLIEAGGPPDYVFEVEPTYEQQPNPENQERLRPPKQIEPGGRMLIWEQDHTWTWPGTSRTQVFATATAYDAQIWGTAQSFTTWTPPTRGGYVRYLMFWIDPQGYVYRWSDVTR